MENKKITPLFFFLSLGTVVPLIVGVTAFLNLSFETLNHVFPDILTDSFQYGYVNYSYNSLRSALAILIIIFPVFMLLERYWQKSTEVGKLSHGDRTIRRWAIYLILFLASATIITDLVVLVQYFVSGEITTRFVLKVVLTLVIASVTGWYYIRMLRDQTKYQNLFAGIVSLLVLGMIVWSFSVMGSPMNQRKLRIDQRRIDDLQSVQWQVINFWQQKSVLPDTLTQLSNPLSGSIVPQDPEFQKGKVYEYQKVSDRSFQLCATFDLPIPKGWVPGQQGGGVVYPMTTTRDAAVSSVTPYPGGIGDSWDHEAGRACFTRTIDPDLYPPYPKPLKE